ncbi:hypothetical protein [Dyadobacter chenhuakuii]|uniref:Uncharacterized protein n=1 Tax=Dyadobacter chenhuakuii TaxID=2909339 RepID=A0A9X1QDK9_9BACT|nr:hypothetical protein [Dyadobacter chenhuakuii]MCF2498393.1 hypothetical protein [Dyadobacter chenhuakuii]
MALPKAKVKERLKSKFPGVNLSNKRIDAIADKLKLPEDSEDDAIDERLDELNDVFSFADMAKNDDRLRILEAEKKKKEQQDNPDPKPSEDDPKPDPSQPTDFAKIIAAAIAPLVEKINSFESGKVGDSRKSQLEAKLKDVNPKFKDSVLKNFGRIKFDKDEDFDAFLEEVEEDAKEFIQAEANDGLGGIKAPVQSKSDPKKQISKEEADAILDKVL